MHAIDLSGTALMRRRTSSPEANLRWFAARKWALYVAPLWAAPPLERRQQENAFAS